MTVDMVGCETYTYTEEERDVLVEEYKAEHNGKEPEVGRYKGLGGMNPETLWETTMDPLAAPS